MSTWSFVVSCEHASRDLVHGLELGVSEDTLGSHVAWDPGAREAALALAWRLGAPCLLGQVTRLVADLNRRPDSPEVVPEVAFGTPVPGNLALSPVERERRLAVFHRPFRDSLRAEVERLVAGGGAALHLSVHSFTTALARGRRDHDVGVLIDPDRPAEVRWARRFCEALEGGGFLAVLNEPYSGLGDSCTSWLRTVFDDGRYAGLEIELSQHLSGARALEAVAALAVVAGEVP